MKAKKISFIIVPDKDQEFIDNRLKDKNFIENMSMSISDFELGYTSDCIIEDIEITEEEAKKIKSLYYESSDNPDLYTEPHIDLDDELANKLMD